MSDDGKQFATVFAVVMIGGTAFCVLVLPWLLLGVQKYVEWVRTFS